jgi:hypothetical protein
MVPSRVISTFFILWIMSPHAMTFSVRGRR